MKKSEDKFYAEKVFFQRKLLLGEKEKFSSQENFFLPKKTCSSLFVINATDCQLIQTIKLNYSALDDNNI